MTTELNQTLSDIRAYMAVNEERWKYNSDALNALRIQQQTHISDFSTFKDIVEHNLDTIEDYKETKIKVARIEREHQIVKGALKGIGIVGVVTAGILGAVEAGINILGKGS